MLILIHWYDVTVGLALQLHPKFQNKYFCLFEGSRAPIFAQGGDGHLHDKISQRGMLCKTSTQNTTDGV